MKYITLSCEHCESVYSLEYEEDQLMGEPELCPFCGEVIDESYKDADQEDEDQMDDE